MNEQIRLCIEEAKEMNEDLNWSNISVGTKYDQREEAYKAGVWNRKEDQKIGMVHPPIYRSRRTDRSAETELEAARAALEEQRVRFEQQIAFYECQVSFYECQIANMKAQVDSLNKLYMARNNMTM